MALFSRAKKEAVIIIDIGNGSVGGGIALLSTERPIILYGTRINIPFQEEVRGNRLRSLMLQSLSQTVNRLLHEGFEATGFGAPRPRIKEVFVALSAPWVASHTSFLHFSSKEPVLVTEEFVLRLIRERELAEQAVNPHILPQGIKPCGKADPNPARSAGHFTQGVGVKGKLQIEQKLMRTELNGYATAAPFGKRASEASFAVLSSRAPEKMIRQITDAVSYEIHSPHISFHSFAFAASAALRELFPEHNSFLHIDASSEQTEISIVKRGVIFQTVSFPYGRNHFIRAVSSSTRASVSAAETLFAEAGEKKGAGAFFLRARRALQKAESDWLAWFSSSLNSFSEELLPRIIFVTADADMNSVLKQAITGADLSKNSLRPVPFQVILIDADVLKPFLAHNPKGLQDPFLCLEAISCGALRRNGENSM